MKKLITASLALMSLSTFAAPSEMKLAGPSKIKVEGKNIKLEFLLPCASSSALDTAKVVITNDDSGDMVASVGLVYSQSKRECEKTQKLKKFELKVDPSTLGYSTSEVEAFESMELAK